MKKTLLTLAVLAGSTLTAASVQAKDLTGGFVNLGVGGVSYHATFDNYDLGSENGTAVILNAGYRTQFIGFEAGYTNLGSISYRDATDFAKLSGDGWTAGINGHFNPTDAWYISARGGAFVWKLHATLQSNDPDFAFTEKLGKQTLSWYAGVGTGYDIDKRWSIGANFDYYKIAAHGLDIGNRIYTVSAEYRF
jgi:OOP family OmpA-OmpF porin